MPGIKTEIFKQRLHIPEGKIGKFSVEHKPIAAGETFDIISMRSSILEGKPPLKAVFSKPSNLHFLKEDGQIWMSDVPAEIYDASKMVNNPSGRVLVGGLGLGYISTLLNEKKKITKLIVVEKSKEVIRLVWPHLGLDLNRCQIIQDDVFDFAKDCGPFDWIFMDIWRSTGETEFLDTVLPLRQLYRKHVKNGTRIKCWRESEMRGQLRMGLISKIQFPDLMGKITEKQFQDLRNDKWFKVQWPLLNWMRKNNIPKDYALTEVNKYIDTYGEPEWDARWKRWS